MPCRMYSTKPAGGQRRPPLQMTGKFVQARERADVGIAPYGGCKGCNGRATARAAPTKALQGVRWGGTMWVSSPTESYHGVRRGGVKFSEFLGCCTGEGNGGGNGEGREGIGENYKEV